MVTAAQSSLMEEAVFSHSSCEKYVTSTGISRNKEKESKDLGLVTQRVLGFQNSRHSGALTGPMTRGGDVPFLHIHIAESLSNVSISTAVHCLRLNSGLDVMAHTCNPGSSGGVQV